MSRIFGSAKTPDFGPDELCRETKGGPSFHSREFRDALGRFASGVAVVTTLHRGHAHGMTASAFVSVSLDPPLVLVSLDNGSHMHRILPDIGRYGVSVLAEDQESFSRHFAGQTAHEVDIPIIERRGMPLLAGAVAHFVVEVVDMHPAGDHTLYIGRVEHLESNSERPLLFYGGGYKRIHAEQLEAAKQPHGNRDLDADASE